MAERSREGGGLMAEFATPEELEQAVHRLRAAGYTLFEAYSPFPMPEVERAMGLKKSILPLFVLLAGLLGASLAYLLQYWIIAVDYPIDVGAMPAHSAPAFIPITFETMVLLASFASFIAFLALTRLPRLWHPVFEVPGFESASVHRFWVGIDIRDPRFDRDNATRLLAEMAARRIDFVDADGAWQAVMAPGSDAVLGPGTGTGSGTGTASSSGDASGGATPAAAQGGGGSAASTSTAKGSGSAAPPGFMPLALALTLGAAAALANGCSTEETAIPPEWGWQRMQTQPKYLPYAESRFFADGRAMQWPPDATADRQTISGNPQLLLGYVGETYARQVPLALDAALMQRGRDRFEIFCAPCHGVLGNAETVVGKSMPLVQPRNLQLPEMRGYPPGRIFRVASEGYGLMASYRMQVSLEERWAIAAYVKALQLARGVQLVDLPNDVQQAARRALP